MRKEKKNIIVTLCAQLISLLCGLIVPRAVLAAFGSEAYGAATSISQFLAYITLVESGIGGVARAAMYHPLAENNREQMGLVYYQVKRFFQTVAFVFIVYTGILACTYHRLANVQIFDWTSTFALVIIISLSTLAQYFIGSANAVLLQADQRTYIINAFSLAATVLNACVVLLLVHNGAGFIEVKLWSGCVFALKPVCLWLYVRKKYGQLPRCQEKQDVLQQKWTGMGQHLAFFLHSHTDVVILTLFNDLKAVAVYSVYNMIISSIQRITASFGAGMEALFGRLIAQEKYVELNRVFARYERLISIVTAILFATTAILLVPFIRLYTADIYDADYVQPVFAVFLLLSAVVYCLRMPYHAVVIAAGRFKETSKAAYGEAIINIFLSVLLVKILGLVGVAIGTLAATCYRFIYYVVYLSRNVLQRSPRHFVRQIVVNGIIFGAAYTAERMIMRNIVIGSYGKWVFYGVIVTLMISVLAVMVFFLAFKVFQKDSGLKT